MARFDGRFFPGSSVSDWSSGQFGKPGWYPDEPTAIEGTVGDGQVALTWTAGNANGQDITGYKIEKNDGSWSTAVANTGSATAGHTVTGLTNGTAYTFRVKAINGVGESESPSSASASKTPKGAPAAPGTLSLAEGTNAGTSVALTWSAGAANGAAITGYKIQTSTDGSSWSNLVADTSSTATTYQNNGLSALTQYWYRVAGINSEGTGPYGNEANHTTSNPPFGYTTTGSPTVTTYTVNSTDYTSLQFTGTGTMVVTGASGMPTFDIMVVAGGGGGGNNYGGYGGGGGGAGGLRTTTGVQSVAGTYTVTVGAGGNPGGASTITNPSSATVLACSGGGKGGSGGGATGGAGGGGGSNGPSSGPGAAGGSGNAGGYSPVEGGNGASGYNSYPCTFYGGYGGAGGHGGTGSGTANAYATGSNVTYGGGGGYGGAGFNWSGGAWHIRAGGGAGGGGGGGGVGIGYPGAANTGGGGGGSTYQSGYAGPGGSGIVVVRWETP